MSIVLGLLILVLHAALIVVTIPVLAGMLGVLRARLAGRLGPPFLQPVRDMQRLLRKHPVLPESASPLLPIAPLVSLACLAAAALLVPSFALGMATAPVADLVVIAGLLAASRLAMSLAALDAGAAISGMAASRAMSLAVLTEPALLLAVFVVATMAGSTNLDSVAGALREGGSALRVSLGLALLATAIVALVEAGRFQGRGSVLGLGQDTAALTLSGWHLAVAETASALRLVVWLAAAAGDVRSRGYGPFRRRAAGLDRRPAGLGGEDGGADRRAGADRGRAPGLTLVLDPGIAGDGAAAGVVGGGVPVHRPGPRLMTGALDIAHLLGGLMLVLALLMLAQRRTEAATGAYAMQSAALAMAAAAQAWAQNRGGLWVAAIVILGVQAVLLPTALRRVARIAPQPDGGSPAAMALGVAAVILAILAVRGTVLPAAMAREDLAASLAVTVLGLLAVITRRDPMGQMLGFLTAASGCTLAAVSLPGLPGPLMLLGLALLLLPFLGVADAAALGAAGGAAMMPSWPLLMVAVPLLAAAAAGGGTAARLGDVGQPRRRRAGVRVGVPPALGRRRARLRAGGGARPPSIW